MEGIRAVIDYIPIRAENMRRVTNYKMIPRESIAMQYLAPVTGKKTNRRCMASREITKGIRHWK